MGTVSTNGDGTTGLFFGGEETVGGVFLPVLPPASLNQG